MIRRRWHIKDLGNGRFRVYLARCRWSWHECFRYHHDAMNRACELARDHPPRRQADYKLAGGDHT